LQFHHNPNHFADLASLKQHFEPIFCSPPELMEAVAQIDHPVGVDRHQRLHLAA
jgi:hypothetical protein